MSRTITPLQMNIVGDDGEVKGQYSPETYAETVTTGSVKKSESLELPGTDPSETLTDTIAKVKLYLDNVSSIASEKREVVDSPDDNSGNIPSTRATASLKASLDAINAIVTKNKEAPLCAHHESVPYLRLCAGAEQHVLCPQFQLLCALVLYAGFGALRRHGYDAAKSQPVRNRVPPRTGPCGAVYLEQHCLCTGAQ